MDVLIEVGLAVALFAAALATVAFVVSSVLLLAIDLGPGADPVDSIDPQPPLAGVLPFVERASSVTPSPHPERRRPVAA